MSQIKMREINQVYEMLSNNEKRKRYDFYLNNLDDLKNFNFKQEIQFENEVDDIICFFCYNINQNLSKNCFKKKHLYDYFCNCEIKLSLEIKNLKYFLDLRNISESKTKELIIFFIVMIVNWYCKKNFSN